MMSDTQRHANQSYEVRQADLYKQMAVQFTAAAISNPEFKDMTIQQVVDMALDYAVELTDQLDRVRVK